GLDTKKGHKNDPKLTGGIDLFYQITPSLKSSLTINTDFAETEVDDRQINLTRFNLHYREKRAFFLDGASYFQFGIDGDEDSQVATYMDALISRRLGLDPRGGPDHSNAAAKISGQIDNWNIGMMHNDGGRKAGSNNLSLARLTRHVGAQTSAGIIGTYGNA